MLSGWGGRAQGANGDGMADEWRIERLAPGDVVALAKVAAGVFDAAVDPARAARFLTQPGTILIVARAGAQVVGQASGLRLTFPDKSDQLWISELTVASPWRRRGIGRALVAELIAAGKAEGCGIVWVDAAADNDRARAFYAAIGGVAAGKLEVFEWRG